MSATTFHATDAVTRPAERVVIYLRLSRLKAVT